MKSRYTYSVLRYVHDVVTGEFANLGVILYSPDSKYLQARCVTTYGRLSNFFGHVNGDHIKRLMTHVESAASRLALQLFDRLPIFGERPEDVMACANDILPPDDSALQFSPPGGGASENLDETLKVLFERYVERYGKRRRAARSDEEVWPVFRTALQEKGLLSHFHPKRIVAPDYEHEFPHAWQNGFWHACEPVSFDLLEAGDILEKANKWLGRGVNLKESSERVELYLLVGSPSAERLQPAFAKALHILAKIPLKPQIYAEDDAAAFAKTVEKTLARGR